MLERGRSSFPCRRTANIWLATRSERFTNARKECWEKYRKFHCISTSLTTQKDLVISFWSSLVLFLGFLPCLVNYLGGIFLRGFFYFWPSVCGSSQPSKEAVHFTLHYLKSDSRHFWKRQVCGWSALWLQHMSFMHTLLFFLFYLLLPRQYFHLKALQSYSFPQ